MKKLNILIAALAAVGAATVITQTAGTAFAQGKTEARGNIVRQEQREQGEQREEKESMNEEQDEMLTAKVRLADAAKTAEQKVPGYVNGAELERENGKTVWSLDVVEQGGKAKKEVLIDADNGSVISVTDDVDNGHDQDGEHED